MFTFMILTLRCMTDDKKKEVLAKSEPPISLPQHIKDCLVIMDCLQKSFPQIPFSKNVEFWNLLKFCIVFHDLGKAHKEFQKVLLGKANKWHYQRHELFSLPFIESLDLPTPQKDLIKLVVAGHHKSFEILYSEYIERQYEEKKEDSFSSIFGDGEDRTFETAFEENISVEAVKKILNPYGICLTEVKGLAIQPIIRKYLKIPFIQSNEQYFQLLLLFGALKNCDHIGSAQVTSIPNLLPPDFAFLEVLQQKLIAKGDDFFPHQKSCANVKGNLILTAPTGSGKTESAFLWLKKQMELYGQGRVFYVLPFTASINAMYERLNDDINPGTQKVGMLHGKLADYLNNYFEEFQYSVGDKKEEINSIKKKFKTLHTPVKVVTPFQLLKHLFGLKGFEQGIFEWVGGYFIFDEIHAYSPEVFAQIKVLLEFVTKHLNTKVMIMTATMPGFLKQELKTAIGSFTGVEAESSLFQSFRRHRVIVKEGLLSDSLSFIHSELKAGKKVLVVCNTVLEAQHVFNFLKDEVSPGNSVLLHSGFNGKDRSIKEKELKKEKIRLLVGTQAIEVSLDIDYDIIFTEPAPIDALVQRFGRVNRRRIKGICQCFVFNKRNKADEYIYDEEVIARTLLALQNIERGTEGIIDEQGLQELIDFVYPNWNEKSQQKFDRIYRYLSDAVQNLSPMLNSKHTEEEFYRQFDGIKVLPQECKGAFIKYLNEFDFISAESLKVQIRKSNFAIWLNNGELREERHVFDTGKGKLLTIPYYLTKKPYNSSVGLLSKKKGNIWLDEEIL